MVEWAKYTDITWTVDGQGFFYGRYAAPQSVAGDALGMEKEQALNQQLYYHAIGTPQAADILVYKAPPGGATDGSKEDRSKWMFGTQTSPDGAYLFITVGADCDPVNQLYYVALQGQPVSALPKDADGSVQVTKLVCIYIYILRTAPCR